MITFAIVAALVFMAIGLLATVRRQPVREAIVALSLLGMVASAVGAAWLVGQPRPSEVAFFDTGTEAKVLWARAEKGKPILLLVKFKGKDTPVYFVLPYSEPMQKKVQENMQKMQQIGRPPGLPTGHFREWTMPQYNKKEGE